jgi:hypothetical protein
VGYQLTSYAYYSLIRLDMSGLGALLIIEFGKRYLRFRRAIAVLRQKEAKLGYDIGMIK